MKKIILILMLVLGSFVFAEITEQEADSFLSAKAQFYISNQKDWFYGENPADFEGETATWEKHHYFISVLPTGNKYKIAYIPFEEVKSYDKEGYPVLSYRTTKRYVIKTQRNENIPTAFSYNINVMFAGMHTGTEIKKGKKYERGKYQILSENELNALLKAKNAKRLDSTTEKNTKAWIDWLFHNNN